MHGVVITSISNDNNTCYPEVFLMEVCINQLDKHGKNIIIKMLWYDRFDISEAIVFLRYCL